MKYYVLFLLFSGVMLSLCAQDNKMLPHDCINPKQLQIPFESGDTSVVYYDEEDKYTFWYTFAPSSGAQVNFEISPLIPSDEYQEILYNYEGKEFCNELVAGKLKPFPLMVEGRTFEKGKKYYLGVLQLYGEGCGHLLTVSSEGKKQFYFAVNKSCPMQLDSLKRKMLKTDEIPERQQKTTDVNEDAATDLATPKAWKGAVYNAATGKPISADLRIESNEGIFSVKSGKEKGFSFEEDEDTLSFRISGYGYNEADTTISYSKDSIKVFLHPIRKGEKLIMRKIYFHPNTYAIKQSSYIELNQLKNFLQENSELLIEIQGHTNSNRRIKKNDKYAHLGDAWNFSGSAKKLSKKRAEKIKEILVKQGVEGERIRTEGYGGDRMIVDNPKTMQQAMKNIRVEVHIIGGQ